MDNSGGKNTSEPMTDAQRIHLKNLSEESGADVDSALDKEQATEKIKKLEDDNPSKSDINTKTT